MTFASDLALPRTVSYAWRAATAMAFGLMTLTAGALGCAEECTVGSEACACTDGGACDPGLECRSQLCVSPGATAGAAAEMCRGYYDLCSSRDDFSTFLADCQKECELTNGGTDTSKEMCWFWSCGVETGWCDNEEPDDATILACARKHGWY